MEEEQIVAAVHAAHATGRVALTFVDQNGIERPTNVLMTLLRNLEAARSTIAAPAQNGGGQIDLNQAETRVNACSGPVVAAPAQEAVACPECGGSLATWKCTCDPIWTGYVATTADQPVAPSVPDGCRTAIQRLIDVARAAWNAADCSEERADGTIVIDPEEAKALADALEALDDLPDDKPGCVLAGAAMAEWALRDLLHATPASTAAPAAPADRNAAQGAAALMTDEEREQLKVAIKVTEYKYFGDYEFSGKQRAAVDTLTTFANRMLSCAARVVPEWQPIETAPLNQNVLLWWRPIDDNKCAECAVIGQISFYEQGKWWNGQTGTYQDIWHVTKWMPVPAAPKPDA
jgi:hypothetical protein